MKENLYEPGRTIVQRWLNLATGLLLAAVLLGGAFRPSAPSQPLRDQVRPEPGYLAPDIAGTSVEGEPTRLSDLRGKAVFLNFWASWCGPCLLEMPGIQQLYAELPPNTAILAVNATHTEASAEAVAQFLQAEGYTFPVMLDPSGEANARYRVMALPTSLFIDPEGVIRKRVAGPMTHAALVSELQAALAPAAVSGAPAPGPLPALPETISLGPAQLNTRLLLLIAGLLLAVLLGQQALKRRGRNPAVAGDLIFGLAVGGFLGGRLAAFLQEPGAYLRQPGLLLAQSGTPFTLVGTVLGAGLWAGWELWRRRREGRLPDWADTLSGPLLLGGAVAYLPTGGWTGAVALVLAAGAHWLARRAGREIPPGQTALAAVLFAAVALVLADFGHPAVPLWGGLSRGQILWAGLGGVAAILAGLQGRSAGGAHPGGAGGSGGAKPF